MVEVASSAPLFSVALCRSRSPLVDYHHSLDLTPMSYPSARADLSKQLLKLKGCFCILLQGSGAVSTLMTRTWLQPLLSWQNHAQKSMLNLKAKCQHPELVV